RWRPGYYVDYCPDWVWCSAQYVWTPAGFVFVPGYWDYALCDRGLVFAPIYVSPVAVLPRRWGYVPRAVVCADFLPTALFVRASWRHYYYGDYFGARYARGGYAPWIDYRIGRWGHDPLYSHDRVRYADRGWDRDLRDSYTARFENRAALPPRTWGE